MKGKELRSIREKLGWTQVWLARAVGVDRNAIARYERDEIGIKEPTSRLIRSIYTAETAKPKSEKSKH